MIAGLAKSIFGSSNDRYVAKLSKIVETINAFEPTISALTDQELASQTVLFRERLANGQYFPLPYTRSAVDKQTKHTLKLTPSACTDAPRGALVQQPQLGGGELEVLHRA